MLMRSMTHPVLRDKKKGKQNPNNNASAGGTPGPSVHNEKLPRGFSLGADIISLIVGAFVLPCSD